MTLNTLSVGEPWMNPDERERNYHLIRALAGSLAVAGVQENALVALRVNDVAVTWLLARRLESALTPTDAEPAPCPTPAQANAIGKCRERLRSAIKVLEGYCTRTSPRKSAPSLADHIYETMRMLEDRLPLTETTTDNTNSAPDSETPPDNTISTESPAAAPRQTPTHSDHATQKLSTAPSTREARSGDGSIPSTREARAGGDANPSTVNPKAFLAWTAREKAPPR